MATQANTAVSAASGGRLDAATMASTASSPRFDTSATPGLPWAGIGVLVVLLVVAWLAKVHGRGTRAGNRGAAKGRGLSHWLMRYAVRGSEDAELFVRASAPLGRDVQLHVVRWADREFLLATGSQAGTVVVDRRTLPDDTTGARS